MEAEAEAAGGQRRHMRKAVAALVGRVTWMKVLMQGVIGSMRWMQAHMG